MSSDALAMLNRAGLEELDKHGTGTPAEEEARRQVITAGHLDRFVP